MSVLTSRWQLPARPTKPRWSRSRPNGPLLCCLAIVALVAVLGPTLAPQSPTAVDPANSLLSAFSPGHLLGTDGLGRDVFSRLIAGTRLTMMVGMVPVVLAAILGGSLGLLAGMGSRLTNTLVMRILDVFYAFPSVLLAIAINAALGPGIRNTIIALTVVLIPPVARMAEAQSATIAREDYVEAASCSGASRLRITVSQVLPNVFPPLAVYSVSLFGLAIIEAAGLSFLGLGASPPTAEWGLMLNEGQSYFLNAPLVALMPAAAIMAAAILFNLLADSLRAALGISAKGLR